MPTPLRPLAAEDACACAAARGSDARGGSCLWRMCAPQGAPCKRAGGRTGCEEGELGAARSHGGARHVRAMLPCCRPADSLAATTTEDVGQLLGFRHTARRRLRRAGCGGVGSRGSLEPGAMEQRALRMPSPLLLRRERVVVGRGHGCGQRTERGDGGEGGAPSAR